MASQAGTPRAVLLDLVDQDHRVALIMPISESPQQRHKAERPVQHQQRRRHAQQCPAARSETSMARLKLCSCSISSVNGDEQHDGNAHHDRGRALAFSTAPATSMR